MITAANPVPTADELRAAFAELAPPTVGVEEEVMLLDPVTLDLLPRAGDVVARAGDQHVVKQELPASQVELVSAPAATAAVAAEAVRTARRRALAAAEGIGRLAGAGAHPFAAPEGTLTRAERYERTEREYAIVARRQLLFGLHVHVAVRPAERALAVYNELRSYLPLLAALSADAPFHDGADSGLQSVRPIVMDPLPRQGVPPAFAGVDELAAALAWTHRAGALPTARQWWWEARLHPWLGTVEVRVFDAQPTVAATVSLAAVAQCLCVLLARRHDDGGLPPPAPSWRIRENRWSACRHGVHGTFADLRTGEPAPARDRIGALLDDLGPVAAELGCVDELEGARALLRDPWPDRLRAVAAERGLTGLVRWLAERFVE